MKRKTRVTDAKRLCEELGARAVIVIAVDRDAFAVTSYGETVRECRQIAKLTDRIADGLASGALPIWESV